jgi:hypothetical protein
MRTRSILIVAGLMVALVGSVPLAEVRENAFDGIWYGSFLDSGKISRVSVNFAEGTVDLPGSMVFDLPVKIENSRSAVSVHGDLRGHPLQIDGKLKDGVLNGTLSLGGEATPFQSALLRPPSRTFFAIIHRPRLSLTREGSSGQGVSGVRESVGHPTPRENRATS